MSNTLTKRGLKGFTLIELLVVIAIIGLLSTVIAAPIQQARKKAKDAKKLAELNAVQLALEQYAEANNNNYPDNLGQLAPTYMPVLPSYALTGAPARDHFAYAVYTASLVGGITQKFAYHLAVHLDVFADALNNDRDCNGANSGVSLGLGKCTFYNSASPPTASYPDYVAGMIGGSGVGVSTDFELPTDSTADGATSTCQLVNDCVYDATGNQ